MRPRGPACQSRTTRQVSGITPLDQMRATTPRVHFSTSQILANGRTVPNLLAPGHLRAARRITAGIESTHPDRIPPSGPLTGSSPMKAAAKRTLFGLAALAAVVGITAGP